MMRANALIASLAHIELPTLGHTLDDGFCGTRVRPIGNVPRIVGTARTVDLLEPDALEVNEAILELEHGEVLVIRVASGVHAPIGAVTRAAAAARSAAGIIVDGPVTDVRTLEAGASSLPVWASGITARTTKRLGAGARRGVPVTIGDARVRPGDIIAADEHGVVVLDPNSIDPALIADARAADEAEPALLARIAAGECLASLLARSPQEDA